MTLKWSRFTHSPPARWRGSCRFGPLLLLPLLVLNITILALLAGTLAYSATTQQHGDTIGIYWDGTAKADAPIVLMYITIPALDLLHTLAHLHAYLSTPRSTTTTTDNLSRLHPAAALSGALVASLAWTAMVSLTTTLDYVGWEQWRDGTWYGLAGARAVVGAGLALLWGVSVGFAAVAVHRWRKMGKGEEGRAREWRRREDGVELGGWGKGSEEVMVDKAGLVEAGRKV